MESGLNTLQHGLNTLRHSLNTLQQGLNTLRHGRNSLGKPTPTQGYLDHFAGLPGPPQAVSSQHPQARLPAAVPVENTATKIGALLQQVLVLQFIVGPLAIVLQCLQKIPKGCIPWVKDSRRRAH